MKRGCSREDTVKMRPTKTEEAQCRKGFLPIYGRAGYVSNCKTVKQKVAAKQKIDP